MATFTTCDKCGTPISGMKIWRVLAEVRGGRPEMQTSPPLRIEDCCDRCVKQIMEPYPREATPRGA